VREHVDELVAAFRSLDGMVSMERFLDHHASAANPLRAAADAGRPVTDYRDVPLTGEQLEAAWRAALVLVFEGFLAPFGGARLGRLPEGFGLELSPIGHHLLGAEQALEPGALDAAQGPEPEGAVLVQPDFSVVLIAASPAAEARLATVAERLPRSPDQRVGALFRLTRASVQAGAHAGLEPEALLDGLLEHGPSPLPGNVRHEVRAWSAEVASLAWERPLVLRCPDAAIAERLLLAAGAHLELLGDRVLVLPDP
jgi:hypothetical protein